MVDIADLQQQPSSSNPFVSGLLGYSSFRPGYTITVVLQASPGDSGLYGGGLWATSGAKDAFVEAAAAWSAVANVTIRVLPDNYQGTGDRSAYTWVETLGDLGEDLLGQHTLPGFGDLGGDFNNQTTIFTIAGNQKGAYGFVTFLHEIGHGLGLTHPFDGPATFPGVTSEYSEGDNYLNSLATTIMSYNDRVGDYRSYNYEYGWAATPMAFDIAAIQLLYGANMSTRTGNDVYVLPSTSAPGSYWQTIWDAGGTDTLSAETASSRAWIDLRPASLLNEQGGGGWASQVADSSGGFFIAHNVTIENAIGSAFDDIITGNAAANHLSGGGGDDQMWGGAGNDIIDGGAGTDTLFGGDNADTLTGGDGNDTLDGGSGDDHLAGGAGDDRYVVDSSTDQISEGADEGHDTVTSSASFVLSENVEDLRLTDNAASGTGNSGDNAIWAASSSVVLHGLGGNDTLSGSNAGDRIFGDEGNDILIGQTGKDELHGGDGDDQLVAGGWVADPHTGASVHFPGPREEGDESFLWGDDGNDAIYLEGSYRPWVSTAYDPLKGKVDLIYHASQLHIDGGEGTDTIVVASKVEFAGTWTSIERLVFAVPGNFPTVGPSAALGPPGVLILTGEKIALLDSGAALSGTGVLQLDLDTITDVDGSHWTFDASAQIDLRLTGNAAGNRIVGTTQADLIEGGRGDDILQGAGGDDTLLGGNGHDLAIFSGNRADYQISREEGGFRILDLRGDGGDGSDFASGIETFQFADASLRSADLAPSEAGQAVFRLVAGNGFAGSLGGSGEIFGTAGREDFTVLDIAGAVSFDPSFNRGGDVIRLAGDAAGWTVRTSGSSAVFSDGDTLVTIPLGQAGTTLVFDDGARTLLFDPALDGSRIGGQTFGTNEAAIAAAAEPMPPRTGGAVGATARLYLEAGASVSASGNLDIYGTQSPEHLTLLEGEMTLDPSFNRGGDEIVLLAEADRFEAALTGSSVVFTGPTIILNVPFGPSETLLSFGNADDRLLFYDTQAGGAFLDSQPIGSQFVALLPAIA